MKKVKEGENDNDVTYKLHELTISSWKKIHLIHYSRYQFLGAF